MRKEIGIALKDLHLEQKLQYCNWGKKCEKKIIREKENFMSSRRGGKKNKQIEFESNR